MPEEQQAQTDELAEEQKTISQFAKHIRTINPGMYGQMEDRHLVTSYLERYPHLASDVIQDQLKQERAGVSRAAIYDADYWKGFGFSVAEAAGYGIAALPMTAGGYYEGVTRTIKKLLNPKLRLVHHRPPKTPVGEFFKQVHLDMDEWVSKKADKIIQNDPELMNWQEEMRNLPAVSFSNAFDPQMIKKTFSVAAPSLAINIAMRMFTGRKGALLTMGALESGSEFRESYEYYRSQPDKYSEEEAYELATTTAMIYGPIASLLENLSIELFFKYTGLNAVARKVMLKKLSDKIGKAAKKSGKKIIFGDKGYMLRTAGKGISATKGVAIAVGRDIALPTLKATMLTAMTESIEEWSQYMAQRIIQQSYRGGWGDSPDEAVDNFTKFISREMLSQDAIFSAYAGAVGGGGMSAPSTTLNRTALTIYSRMRKNQKDLSKETVEAMNKVEKEATIRQKVRQKKMRFGKSKYKIDPDKMTKEELDAQLEDFEKYPQTITGYMQFILDTAIGDIKESEKFFMDNYDSDLGAIVIGHENRRGLENLSHGRRLYEVIDKFKDDSMKNLTKAQQKLVNSIINEETGIQDDKFDKFILSQFDGNIVDAILSEEGKKIKLNFVDSRTKIGDVETRVEVQIDEGTKQEAIRRTRQFFIENTKTPDGEHVHVYPGTDKLLTPEDLPKYIPAQTLAVIEHQAKISYTEHPELYDTAFRTMDEVPVSDESELNAIDQLGETVPEDWNLVEEFDLEDTPRTRKFAYNSAVDKYGRQNVRIVNVLDDKNNATGYQVQVKEGSVVPDEIPLESIPDENEETIADDETTKIDVDKNKLREAAARMNQQIEKEPGVIEDVDTQAIADDFVKKIVKDEKAKAEDVTKPIEAEPENVQEAEDSISSITKGFVNKLKEEGGFLRIAKPTDQDKLDAYEEAAPVLDELWRMARDWWDIDIHEFVPAFVRAANTHGGNVANRLHDLLSVWMSDRDLMATSEYYENIIERKKDFDLLDINKRRNRQITNEILSSDEFNSIVYKRNEVEEEDGQPEDIVDGRRAAMDFRSGQVQVAEAFHMGFLLEPVTEKEQKELFAKMREMPYEDFREGIIENYWSRKLYKNYKHLLPEYERLLRKDWNDEQSINKKPRSKAPEYQMANVTAKGEWIDPKPKGIKGVKRNITLMQGVDPKTGNRIPDFIQNTFGDERMNKLGVIVNKLRFSNILTIFKRKDGSMYGREYRDEINKVQTFPTWDAALSRSESEGKPTPHVIVGARTGGRGSILMVKVSNKNMQDSVEWESYWDDELSIYSEEIQNQTKIDIGRMFKTIRHYGGNDNYIMAQIIARHEFMKNLKFTKYLEKYSVIDIYRRISLDFAAGKVAVGIGNSVVRVFDPYESEVRYKNKPVRSVEVLKEMDTNTGLNKVRYLFDGIIPVSEEYLYKLGKLTGYNDTYRKMFEAKTVINHKEGEDYLAVKGMEMIVRPGFSWYRNGELVAKSIKQKKDGKTFVNIVNAKGERIDKLLSTEEVKHSNGKFEVEGEYEIPEEATRLLQTQSPVSKNGASHLNAWIHLLDDKKFSEVKKLLVADYQEIVNSYLHKLYQIRTNEGKKKFIQSLYRENSFVARELDRRIRPDGKKFVEGGYHAIDINEMTAQQIYSQYIDDGLLRGRKKFQAGLDPKEDKHAHTGSTYATLKPNMTGEIENLNEMIVGDNKTIINLIKEKIGVESFKKQKDSIKVINKWLKDNEFYVIPFRQPVNGIYDIHATRVIKIDQAIGDGFEMHPSVVFDIIKGDFDGDKIFVHVFNDEITGKIKDLEEDPEFLKYNIPADLGIYENKSGQTHYLDPSSFYRTMYDVVLARNAPGIVRTAMLARRILESMEFKIQLDGAVIEPKLETDEVDMVYAPLHEGVTDESLPEGVEIIQRDKKRYLRTKVFHEMAILMNAATDVKDLLLSQWGYNDSTFMISRIFRRTDGKPITPEQEQALGILVRMMNPRNSFKKSDNFSEFYEDSEELHNFKEMNTEQRMANLYQRFADTLVEYGIDDAGIRQFRGNGYMDPLLSVLAFPYEVNKAYNLQGKGIKAEGNPTRYSSDILKNAHYDAIDYIEENKLDDLGIKADMIADGNMLYRVALKVRKEFDEMHRLGKQLGDYSTVKIEFIDRWLKNFNKAKFNREQINAINYLFLKGMPDDSPIIPKDVKVQRDKLRRQATVLLKKVSQTTDPAEKEVVKQKLEEVKGQLTEIVGKYKDTTKSSDRGIGLYETREKLLPAELMTDEFIYAYSEGHNIFTASDKPINTKRKKQINTIATAYQKMRDKNCD